MYLYIFTLACALSLFTSVAFVSYAETVRELKIGARGADVKELQAFLRDAGYVTTKPTGYFGPSTKAAVIKWQKKSSTKIKSGTVPKGTVFTLKINTGTDVNTASNQSSIDELVSVNVVDDELRKWQELLKNLQTQDSVTQVNVSNLELYKSLFDPYYVSYPELVDSSKNYIDLVGKNVKNINEIDQKINDQVRVTINFIEDAKQQSLGGKLTKKTYDSDRSARDIQYTTATNLLADSKTSMESKMVETKKQAQDWLASLAKLQSDKAVLDAMSRTPTTYTSAPIYVSPPSQSTYICNTSASGSILSTNRTYSSTCSQDTRTPQEKCDARKAALVGTALTDPTAYQSACADLGL